MRQDILVVIPAYNEAGHIEAVIGQAGQTLPVLVVDDGSADQTAALAERAGAAVLRQVPNQGKGAALRAGFRYAIDAGCAAAITLDADGQHDPAEIPAFLEAFDARQSELIIGARDYAAMPFVRRFANTVGRWAFTWALGRSVPDNQSGYRLIGRRLMADLLTSQEQGFEFEVEMIATAVQRGYPIDWVRIRTIYAGETSHIQPLRHVTNFFRVVWQTRQGRRQHRRLY
jgi:glycosyltransferase involved in cell wall biosynthesis